MRPSVAPWLALAIGLTACGPTAAGVPHVDHAPDAHDAPRPAQGRLPTDVEPLGYRLSLRVVPGETAFEGTVEIRVRLTRPRDVIWLHGRELSDVRARMEPASGPPVHARFEQVGGDGLAAVWLAHPVGPGEATLRLRWRGAVRTDFDGLFSVQAGDREYLFTQLEPLNARQVFPGFDEPAFKTPFDLSLTVPDDQVALANTRVVDEQPAGAGMKTVRFATTEPLPTYLVAFAVGPLDVVDVPPVPPNPIRARPLPFRGVAVHGRGEEMAWTLSETPALLALLEDYFGSPYPFGKLDVIAIPGYGGAMENPGAITFADSLLLLDPAEASPQQVRWFAYTMAHELSHQWCGDLVTMEWWDDLWLNEAFASFMETKIVDRWKPEWHAERDRVEQTLDAMEEDGLASARYVRQPIESVHDIHNAFDWITYVKGAAVLTMFERWLGEETFQHGVRRYIADRRSSTATADDLMRALSEEAGRDVSGPMRSFLTQSGIPTVDARLSCPDDGPPVVSLAQSRYLPVGSRADADRTWQVPVCIAYGAGGERERVCLLLTEPRGRAVLQADGCPEWVMPNADATGYYRWTLSAEGLESLRTRGLEHLTVTERMALADNLEAAFDSGRTPGADVLRAMAPLTRDETEHVATAPMDLLAFVDEYVVTDAERPALHRWIDELYAPRLRRLGFDAREGEPQQAAIERSELVEHLALVAEDAAVRREAVAGARRYLGIGSDGALHPGAVAPASLPTVLVVAARAGDAALFDVVERHLDAVDDSTTRRNLLVALGSFRDPELAARARAAVLDGRLGPRERLIVLRAQMDDRVLREDTWVWLREHLDALSRSIGSPPFLASLPALADTLCTAGHATEARELFGAMVDELPGGPRNLAEAVETIELCAARVEAQAPSVRGMFAP